MKKIREKLSSRKGASLLLAIIFMMFCCFVGGAILAASTQQMTYVRRMTQTEQQYLTQRSAMSLISDSLKSSGGENLRMTVAYKKLSTQKVIISDGGVERPTGETVPDTYSLTFTLSGVNPASVMQRFICETTILRYLEENGLQGTPFTISGCKQWYPYIDGENESGEIDIGEDFIVRGAGTDSEVKITVTDPTDPGNVITAYVVSGEGERKYNFVITFGENVSQVAMTMYAHITERPNQVSAPEYGRTDAAHVYNKITVASSIYIIDWDSPVMEKGGLED